MLAPKRTKFRKAHRGSRRGKALARGGGPVGRAGARGRGGGKGTPEAWVAVIKPGRILFEIAGVSEDVAREAMRLAGHKLPIRTKFTTRPEGAGGWGRRRGTGGERRVGRGVVGQEARPRNKEEGWRIVRVLEHRPIPATGPDGEAESGA